MKKQFKLGIVLVAALCTFFITSPVYAHVTVHPMESQTGAYEKYTIRVPVEKENKTTELTMKVPNGVSLVSVMPMDDWEYKMNKDAEGNVSSVVWKAKKDGIGPNEFMEFSFIGANPNKAGKISWKADQKYDDGSVVKWEGAPDAEEPASVTNIVKAAEGSDHQGAHGAVSDSTEADEATNDNNAVMWVALAVSIVSLIVSIIALAMKRKTK